MAVEQAGGGHKTDFVPKYGLIDAGRGGFKLTDDRGHLVGSPVVCYGQQSYAFHVRCQRWVWN